MFYLRKFHLQLVHIYSIPNTKVSYLSLPLRCGKAPAPTCKMPVVIVTGSSLFIHDLSPSCPSEFPPQHRSVRFRFFIAQVWKEPTAISKTLKVTKTGKFLFFVVPSPSCPYWFHPQHHKEASFITAQV